MRSPPPSPSSRLLTRLLRELGQKSSVGDSLDALGALTRRRGDLTRGVELHEEALSLFREAKDRLGIAEGLEALGAVAADQRHWEHAAQLFGAAETLRKAIGAGIPSVDRADYDRGAAAVRVALGEVAEVRWAEGRAMSLDQALEHALSRAP